MRRVITCFVLLLGLSQLFAEPSYVVTESQLRDLEAQVLVYQTTVKNLSEYNSELQNLNEELQRISLQQQTQARRYKTLSLTLGTVLLTAIVTGVIYESIK